ncbi:MAG: MurT ligase domain-containing protein [Armatimonadota bacterium]|nr:MurT ligase domain-containing protein [Armatimonadota bacterium]MDR5696362.1 MurT ligase domain-containing protein [Armatimonadota bacterium]
MSIRLTSAIVLGKASAGLSRVLGLGGGTTVPGRVARTLDPQIVRSLGARLPHGTVVVTGTNGKTTTARLISHILSEAGLVPVHNRAGANLPAGIAAALVECAHWRGGMRGDVGVFEVDEATLPAAIDALRPRVVVLTNLFRDQLDRYGEVDIVAGRWREAIAGLPPETVVCFNADDPQVGAVVERFGAQTIPFGIEDESAGGTAIEDAADARYCYRCATPYDYRVVYLSHLGDYTCARCGAHRPELRVRAEAVCLRGTRGADATVVWDGVRMDLRTVLPGLYNVYNLLAATAAAAAIGIHPQTVRRALASFAPVFGRAERLRWDGVDVQILLAKNPAGFNEVLRALKAERPAAVLIAINDRTADGHDISWLWDVDFEMLCDLDAPITVSGIRAAEMALRLKYAGVDDARVTVVGDLDAALAAARRGVPDGGALVVVPTYTAMLELRRVLRRRGVVRGFWED